MPTKSWIVIYFYLPFFILVSVTSFAQLSTKDTSSVKAHSQVKVGLNYLSDNVYLGRKDSARISYLSPSVGYYHKSGLYATGGISLLTTGNTRIDAENLTGGYLFSIGNFDGDISASKYFYNSNSKNIRSEIQGSIDATAAYDFNEIVYATLEGSLNFGVRNDYLLSFALDHTFYMDNDRLRFRPSFAVNGGTQNYYSDYYTFRKLNKRRLKKDKPPIVADVSGATQFRVLDYECGTQLSYTIHKITILFDPVYAIPVHPAVIKISVPATGNTRYNMEQVSNQFYWSVGMYYKW